jgi:predicted PurR-regulated permease PerM
VVGGSIGLPAIWVLAAVSLGGSLFGVIGMLVFIPIVSVCYTLLKENVNKRLEEKQIHIE